MGAFTKPCKSTCKKHPCELVDQGLAQPGGDCRDRRVYMEAYDSVISGLQSGDPEYTHGLQAAQVAGIVEIVSLMRDAIVEAGVMVLVPFVTKAGDLILHDGELVGEHKPNPLLQYYIKMVDSLGVNLPELMMTPRAIA